MLSSALFPSLGSSLETIFGRKRAVLIPSYWQLTSGSFSEAWVSQRGRVEHLLREVASHLKDSATKSEPYLEVHGTY